MRACDHTYRLVVHDEAEVTVRADQGIENVYDVPRAPAYGTRSQWSTNVPNAPLPVAVTRFPSNAICGSPCSGSCISTRLPVIVTGEAPLSPDRSELTPLPPDP